MDPLMILFDHLPLGWRKRHLKWKFRRNVGYAGDFENPKTFNEKIQFRKLYGNDHTYAEFCDKYRIRAWVADQIGDEYLVPLLGVYNHLSLEDLKSLPSSFIVKANHGCGWNRIVRDKEKTDLGELVRFFNGIMHRKFNRTGERYYRLIEPKIMVETLLLDRGKIPVDYKVFCFNNKGGFRFILLIVLNRFVEVETYCLYGEDLKQLDMEEWGWAKVNTVVAPIPENIMDMVELARILSRDFDFIRVDMYNLDGRIYFGEFTFTPANGLTFFKPCRWDLEMGQLWDLDRANPFLYRSG
jgi:hypothetical protein